MVAFRWAALVFVAYLVTAKVGLTWAPDNPSATPVWPPTGIAIAALLLGGYRMAPAVFCAAALANVTTADTPVLVALGIAAGNTAEAVTARFLLTRVWNFDGRFGQAVDVAAFAVLAGGVATAVSATVGPLTLVVGTPLDLGHVWPVARVWWLGDALGALLVCPAVLLFAQTRKLDSVFALAAIAVGGMMTAAQLSGSTAVTAVLIAAAFAALTVAFSQLDRGTPGSA